jgi:hypothetical protein
MASYRLDREEVDRNHAVRQEDAIGGPQLGSSGLASYHRELVAEHHDFELLELIGSKAQRGELQDAPEYDVTERPEH